MSDIKFNYNEQEAIDKLKVNDTLYENYIGCNIRYKNPRCLIEKEDFVITGIQKTYYGNLAYRVKPITGEYGWAGEFGRVANFEDIYFI